MKIILNDKEVKKLATENLPILIHGKESSGASLYTISLAAQWFQQGYSIVFLCGYPMAQEEFIKMKGNKKGLAQFFTKKQRENFKMAFNRKSDKRIVFVKNIELFNEDIFNLVSEEKNLVLSGDVNKSNLRNMILHRKFTTTVYFSEMPGVEFPKQNKYEGYMISSGIEGTIKLES